MNNDLPTSDSSDPVERIAGDAMALRADQSGWFLDRECGRDVPLRRRVDARIAEMDRSADDLSLQETTLTTRPTISCPGTQG